MDTEQARPNSPNKPPEPNTPQHRPPCHRPRRPDSSPNGYRKPFNHSHPLTEQQSSSPRSHEKTQEPHQKGQRFNHSRPVREQQSSLPPRSHERSSAPHQKAQHFNNSRAVAEQEESSLTPRIHERTPGSHQKAQDFNNCRVVAEQQQQSSSPPRSHERTPGPRRKAQRFNNSRPITEHQSPRSHERTPGPHQKASLLLGKVVTLREGFGFLRPESESSSSFGKDVHFMHGDHSKFETGLMALQIGDILEYAPTAFSSAKPAALYGRLMTCRRRTPVDLHKYVNSLLARCDDDHHVHVLEEVVKCPVGFLMMLGLQRPSAEMVTSVMKLSKLVSDNVESTFNRARLERFFSMFRGSSFLNSPGALREHVSRFSIDKKLMCLFKSFVKTAIKYCPEIGREVVEIIGSLSSEECYCELLMEFVLMTFHCNSDSSGRLPWHQMPPTPLQNEISEPETRIPLPCVKKSGSYGTVDTYVDTYYRLLREDCFAPLRNGIAQLKAGKLDIRDMKVWINVTVEGVKLNDRAPGVTVALKASRMSSHNGEKLLKYKPPMNGNLICLSLDGHFKSPFWAVVHRCEEMDDTFIFVLVEILMGPSSSEFGRGVDLEDSVSESIVRLLTTANSKATFVENPSLYKAYEPVLRGLQEMPWENFPFLDEIIYTRWPHQSPDYLSNSSVTVDWSCIFGEKNELRSDIRSVDGLINAGYRVILDDSQLKAVKLALNNRLVLIQGPPGTGKTFVATKILKMLLSASTPSGPVLVITYKNQGLDNFLQRCLEFCPSDLVRIGGRSTEASLEAFNLRAKIKRYDELKGEYDENLEKLGDAKREMEKAIQQVYNCSSFDVESFVSIINDVQLRKFLFEKDPTNPFLLLIPEGMAIADFLHDDSVNSKKLYSSIRQILKNWIPKQETFEQVKECLAPEPTVSLFNGLKLIGEDECEDDVKEVKIWTEQYLEAKQEDENLTPGFFRNNKSKKELQEMKDSIFKPDNSTKDSFFKHITLFDINTTQYHWLLDRNLWDLNPSQRAILVQIIREKNTESAISKLRDAKKTYDSICTALEDIDRRRKLKALQSAKIVGMTTTGAAMYREILGALKPSIVMVEEAAEVLEPQLLVAIGPSVQHLILIGDHKQLSPSVEVYELETKHNFTVSLFERLIEHNNMPFQALGHQSRMREEFVPLIKSIYPKLQTNIRFVSGDRNKAPACMLKSMYFWCHAYEEESKRSVSNRREATMVVALLRWLISERQSLEEITVLCAYNGQTALLRKMLQSNQDLRDAQVTSIDRFQGSENKVIILSLVRCNDDGRIGYLRKLNRYCVAVSRARGGLYLCGNEDTLKTGNDHWTWLFEYMRGKGCMGEKLPVQCPRHPDKKFTLEISNRNLENFKPQLCKRICNAQLSCGHSCHQSCHFGDHPKCEIVIRFRFKGCGHEGARKCSQTEDMVSCQQEVFHTFLLCGHRLFVQCWQRTKQELKCHELCGKKLDCGHPCKLQCFKDCKTNECTVCIEIKEAKLKQEKQQRLQQIKMILEESDNEIKQLESSPNSGPCITDLKDDAEYMQVKDRTEKFIQPGHNMALVVTKVQKVINPKLELKFRQARKSLLYPDVEPQLLFHGTDDAAINGITKEGFRLPNANKRNMFGRGCYFATDSSKSAQNIYTKGSNKLLLCAVLLGQALTVQEDYPEMDAEELRKKQCDSLFSRRGGAGTGGTLYDEYIVYNPNQAFPRYIVHYRDLHNPNPLAASMFSQNLTRISIKSSEALVTNPSHDYHFRLAESQFYRMSTSHKFKVTQADVIFNKQLEDRYEKAKGKLGNKTTEKLVFHGTNHAAIENIISEGFKIGGKGVEVRNGASYGAGVYTATNPDISISYCRGEQRMLLSLVLVGSLHIHYSHGASKDVLVIKHEDYLLPRYIVYFAGST